MHYLKSNRYFNYLLKRNLFNNQIGWIQFHKLLFDSNKWKCCTHTQTQTLSFALYAQQKIAILRKKSVFLKIQFYILRNDFYFKELNFIVARMEYFKAFRMQTVLLLSILYVKYFNFTDKLDVQFRSNAEN